MLFVIWLTYVCAALFACAKTIRAAWCAGYSQGRADEINLSPIHRWVYTDNSKDRDINRVYANKRAARDVAESQRTKA